MDLQQELFTPHGGPTRNETVYPAGSDCGYYVTAIDAGRVAKVAGPYSRHDDALDAVAPMSERAYQLDPRSWFYAWGTCLLSTRRPGLLTPDLR